MSNLVEHAKHELSRINEDDVVVQGYLKIIQAFADMRHSGGSAAIAVPTLVRLLQFENLAPLTNDPDEWWDRSKESGYEFWQNKRNSKAFSYDAGMTYYFYDEPKKFYTAKEKR